MNEETYTERTPLYGIDALAVVEYGVRVALGGGILHPGWISRAYMEADGRVCFKLKIDASFDPSLRCDAAIRYAAAAALNGVASAMKLSNVDRIKIFAAERAREYGYKTLKVVAAALRWNYNPADNHSADVKDLVDELGWFRAAAMTSPMDPAETELAANLEAEYAEMFDKASKDAEAVRRAAASAEDALNAEFDQKIKELHKKTADDVKAIRAKLVSDAVKLAKDVGFDGLRRKIPGDSEISGEIEKRVAGVA